MGMSTFCTFLLPQNCVIVLTTYKKLLKTADQNYLRYELYLQYTRCPEIAKLSSKFPES